MTVRLREMIVSLKVERELYDDVAEQLRVILPGVLARAGVPQPADPDPAKIIAEHAHDEPLDKDVRCLSCGSDVPWPCETYRLASALRGTQLALKSYREHAADLAEALVTEQAKKGGPDV